MAKRRSLLDTLADVETSAGTLTAQADAVTRAAEATPHVRTRVPLDAISDRVGGDTRPVTPEFVAQLADSIAAFGLIQPIVIDRHQRLLAGGHRRAALQLLRASDPEGFAQRFGDGIPVHVYDLDASQDPGRAMAIEISENEKRRDYTRAEAIGLADKLTALGYSYRSTPGAPKAGEKMLVPALALMIGKSEKTIRRYLQGGPGPAEEGSPGANVDTVQIHPRTLVDLAAAAASPALTSAEVSVCLQAREILQRLPYVQVHTRGRSKLK